MQKLIFLKVERPGQPLIIGSWPVPKRSNAVDGRRDQLDIGWHIHHALLNGAETIEVVTGLGIQDGEIIDAD